MKNIVYISAILCFLMTISSCEKDNMAGPDAAFFGSIRDSLDGTLVEQDMWGGSTIEAYEHGYETPSALNWDYMYNGEFRNNMVFSNTYDIYFRNGNFFPLTFEDFVINPGDNEHDFTVVPYIRIRDVEITRDTVKNRIVATFNTAAGRPSFVKIKSIYLFSFSDIYVSTKSTFTITGSSSRWFRRWSVPSYVERDGIPREHTLYIDLGENDKTFIEGRDYFFRVGAEASVEGVGIVRPNYAPYVKISL